MVNGHEFFDSFQLNNYFPVHQEVYSISAFKFYSLILNWQIFLLLNAHPTVCQFVGKANFIGRLQQPRTKLAMDSNRGAYDLLRERIMS